MHNVAAAVPRYHQEGELTVESVTAEGEHGKAPRDPGSLDTSGEAEAKLQASPPQYVAHAGQVFSFSETCRHAWFEKGRWEPSAHVAASHRLPGLATSADDALEEKGGRPQGDPLQARTARRGASSRALREAEGGERTKASNSTSDRKSEKSSRAARVLLGTRATTLLRGSIAASPCKWPDLHDTRLSPEAGSDRRGLD